MSTLLILVNLLNLKEEKSSKKFPNEFIQKLGGARAPTRANLLTKSSNITVPR